MNKQVLQSLKSVSQHKDTVVISDSYINVEYWDTLEYDEEQKRINDYNTRQYEYAATNSCGGMMGLVGSIGCVGPRGWANVATPKSVGYRLSFDVPIAKVEIITKIMTALGVMETPSLVKHYKDGGLIFSLANKVKGSNVIHHDMQIVKQPWFNKMLKLVQDYDPTYDEETLMDIQENYEGSGYTYNTNAVSLLREPWTEYVTVMDETVKVFNIVVTDIDVPKHSKMIDSIIGLILTAI